MITEQQRAELLPCPFCGGEAIMQEHPPHQHSDWLVKMGMPEYSPGSFTIECVECECGMIHETREGVVAAWSRRAALQSQDREDAERLDWLEEQAQASRTGVSIDYVYDAEDGYVNEKGYRFMRYRFIGPLGRSAREAIDHARRVEENK